jgi:hypothetical protein
MATITALRVLSVTDPMAREMPVMARATEPPMAMPTSSPSLPILATQLTLPETGQGTAPVQERVMGVNLTLVDRGNGLKEDIVSRCAFMKTATL